MKLKFLLQIMLASVALLILVSPAFVHAQEVKKPWKKSAHGAGEIIDVRPLLFRQVTEAL